MTAALMRRELTSVGIPDWAAPGHRRGAFFAYCFNSDAGPDEIRAQKIVMAECESDDHVFAWCIVCFTHQANLIVREQLSIVDKHMTSRFKYFATIAKIVTCWRSEARGFYNKWVEFFGPQVSIAVAKKLPPVAIAGRWGSVSQSERYLLNAGLERIGRVASSLWSQKP